MNAFPTGAATEPAPGTSSGTTHTPDSGRSAWTSFHNRGETLRAVAAEADRRRDGTLPWALAATSFRDELDLVGALQLRWYTRLSSAIERRLTSQPLDLAAAVEQAWVRTATELPGTRAILDREQAEPTSPAIARALAKARAKERVLLATMAGEASQADPLAEHAGERIEDAARAAYLGRRSAPAAPASPAPVSCGEQVATGSARFVERIKAVLAA